MGKHVSERNRTVKHLGKASDTKLTLPAETLDDRLDAHSEMDSSDAELNNLQALLRAAFELLPPEQRAQVLADNPIDQDFRY